MLEALKQSCQWTEVMGMGTELESLVSRRMRWSWRIDDARDRLQTACRLWQRELDRLHPWARQR